MSVSSENIAYHPTNPIARAAQAMADYKAGVADETSGKQRAIHAVIEYGQALLEGRNEHTGNTAFKTWVHKNKLDIGTPWSDRYERSKAMQLAAVLGSVPNIDFEGCLNTRPADIMKWYRKTHPKPQPARPARTTKYEKAFEIIKEMEAKGERITEKTLVKRAGVSKGTAGNALSTYRKTQEVTAEIQSNEDQALAAAEEQFSAKSKLTVADAVRIYKARLEKNFEAVVSAEVRRRIDIADDHARKQLKECQAELLIFQRERGKRGVFSKRQFKQLQILCHPDNSASPELRAELLQVLVRYESSLVNPEKE